MQKGSPAFGTHAFPIIVIPMEGKPSFSLWYKIPYFCAPTSADQREWLPFATIRWSRGLGF